MARAAALNMHFADVAGNTASSNTDGHVRIVFDSSPHTQTVNALEANPSCKIIVSQFSADIIHEWQL